MYTILSAEYANSEHTSAVIQTEAWGSVLISEYDTPDDWADMLAWGTPEDYDNSPPPYTSVDVDTERLRRSQLGMTFDGEFYQTRATQLNPDQTNIHGMATAALAALASGATEGDLRWQDPDTDFVWIAEDNTLVEMDAYKMAAFGSALGIFLKRLTFAAAAIKAELATDPTLDIMDDDLWPTT
jgi:hypothetical protein